MTSTQTKLTFAKRILGALTTLVLVACGGGGGGAGSGGGFLPDNNGTPTPSYTLTVSGKSAGGTATNEFSASSPLTIEVLVEDTSTNTASVVSGAVVELQSTVGTITPANASALTNASGIAEFTLGFNQEEGAGTVTASYVVDGTTYSGTFNVQSIVEPTNEPVITLSLAATNSTGDTVTTLSQRSPATLTASFLSTLDGAATPISGELVTITTNVGDVSPSNNTALTDVNGDAVFTVSFNGTEGAGSVGVTASLDGVAYTDTLNLQAQDTGAPYEISIQIVNESDVQTNVLSSSQPLTVQALVRRIDGGLFIPVGAGESVQLATTLGSIAGNGSALTNAQGIASFDVTFDGTVGAGSVTASYDSTEGSVTKVSNIQAVATATGYTLDLVAIPAAGMDANTFAQGAPITLRATLASPTSSVANQAIALNTSVGQVAPANGVTLTDANGVAIFEVAFNDVIGAGVATATFNPIGGAIGTSVNLEAVVADPTAGLEVSTFADDGSVTTEFAVGSPMTVRVQLTDGVGAAALKAGEIINLSSSIGTLNAASKLTDSNGVATFELRSEGVVGAGTLEATYQTDLGLVRAQQTVQSVSTTPYVITVTSAGGPMTLGQDITLTVNLEQPNGTPAVGEIVTLQSTIGSLNKTSALTNGLGDAVFVLSYADQIGAGIVTASFNSGTEVFSNTATVEAVVPAGPTVSIATTVGGVASTQFDAASDMTVVVTVAGSADYAVSAGDTVSLASTIGTVAGNGTALLVDNAGNLEATFTVSSDGTVGAGTLTASIDVSGTVFDSQRNVQAAATDTNFQLTLYQADGTTALNGSSLSAASTLSFVATLEGISTGAAVAVANELVSVSSTIGSLNQASTLTGGTGEASFVLNAAGVIGAGVVTATFETSLGTVTAQANVSVTSDSAVSYNVAIGNGSNGWVFSDANPLTLGVTVAATDASDLSGQLVTLTTDLGTVVGNGTAVLADVAGAYTASFTVDYASVVGAGTLTASFTAAGETYVDTQSIEATSSEAYTLGITPDVAQVTLGTPMTLTVSLDDAAGNPVASQTVNLTSTIGNLNRTSGVTDAAGETDFVLSYGGASGDGLVTATYQVNGNTYTQTLRVVVADTIPATVSIATTVGGVASTQFDAASDMTVVVTVAGSADYAVSAGDTVSLASTIGTVAGNGTALLVDNAGNLEATFTVSSDGTVGAGTLTASIDVGVEVFSTTRTIESQGAPYELSTVTFEDANGDPLPDAIVSSGDPRDEITAFVTLTDLDGNPLENRLIQFVTTKGQLSPVDGYDLTDATGVASVKILYTDDITSGIGELTASYVSGAGTVSVSADVQAVAPELEIGVVNAGNFSANTLATTPSSGSLVNQGSAVLQLDILKVGYTPGAVTDADRSKAPQTVAFSSFCLENGLSTLLPESPITTSSGQVSATYTAGAGCTGDDEVIATLQFGGSATAQTASQVLTIAASVEAVSIEAVDVTPTTLAIAGTGALSNVSETAVAQFRVVDGNGSPVQGETVNFSLSSPVGGLALSAPSAVSGSDGLVSVTLNSGNVPTSTLVTAELNSTGQLISSTLVTVSTAIPDQNSFTIFSDNLSVSQAYPAVNQTSNISVRLADRYNNVVPDGSVVYFTTEYGAIDASCSIVSGECSVVWRSQAPKPIGSNLSTVDCPDYDNDGDGTANNDALGTFDPCPSSFLSIEQGSRTTILATTTGEESFLDVDGDGLMSDFLNEFIDAQHDLGEPYLDANEDGAYQINEFFVDDDSSGSREDGDNLYTGIGCTAATLTSGECTGTMLSVFDNISLILSPSDNLYIALVDIGATPDLSVLVEPGVDTVAAGSYVAYFSDQYNNQPANGATITVSATGDCSIVSPTTFTVPNNNAANAYRIGIEIASVAATAGADTVSVSITNPGAATVTQTFSCIP